jgi:predicted nucleic acid-binding Zn ribbon protein
MLEATHYDSLLEDAETPPPPCPVCTGDEDAEPCGEECAELIAKVERKNALAGLRVSLQRVMWWARTYYDAAGKADRRVLDCLARARFYRNQRSALRDDHTWVIELSYGECVEQAWVKGKWQTVRTFYKEARSA